MTLAGDGNVGIGDGAIAPQSLLHLYKNTDDIVISDISYSNVLRLTSHYQSASHKRGLLITFTNRINNTVGKLKDVKDDDDNHSEYYMAAIGSHQRGADDYNGSLSFYTKSDDNISGDDSTTLQERMTITHDGKVGIGTTTLIHIMPKPAPTPYTSGISVSNSDVRMILGNVGSGITSGSIQVYNNL